MTHPELVRWLRKPGYKIKEQMSTSKMEVLHMAVGISGEAGELLDTVKKCTIYNQQIDIENIIEELGDLEFYMEGLRQLLIVSRDECLLKNIEKLSIRYKEGYSDEAAKARVDKS